MCGPRPSANRSARVFLDENREVEAAFVMHAQWNMRAPGIRSSILPLLKQTYTEWTEDKAPRLAAALAFYSALSLAPLLVIIVAVLGLAFGAEAARGEIASEFRRMLGAQGADTVQMLLASAHKDQSGSILATIIGFLVLLLGASGVFGELQGTLDTIWEVQPRPGRGLRGILKDRFFSFTMVMVVAFLLLVSLVISAALTAASAFFARYFGSLPILWQAINQAVSFGVMIGIFALIFKVVPDVKIAWRDVWVGAAVTAFAFTVGKFLIGLYLGRSATTSVYGAAGSLVAVLLWVYYSAQILFFGAELTQVYAKQHGSRLEPSANAVPAPRPSAQAPYGAPPQPSTSST
jgi:membrane protein